MSIASSDAFEARFGAPAAEGKRRVAAFCLALFAFLVWLSPRSSLWDRDEPLYARVALDMAASGDVLVPGVAGKPWLEKPPLLFWMQAAALRAGFPLETAMRFPSALAFALSAWFTFKAAALLRPGAEAATAAAVFLASPLAILHGAAATTDALLLAGTAAALWALALLVRHGPSRVRTAGLATAMAVGLLTKGPPGVVLPLLSSVPVLLALDKGDRKRLARPLAAASLASVAAFVCWALPANAATNGLVVSEFLGRHVIRRSLEPHYGHGGLGAAGILVYPVVILVGFAPWTLFLPAGLRAIWSARRSPGAALVLGSIASPILVFTLAATKSPNYVLPAFPALAVAAAAGIHARPFRPRVGLALYLPAAAAWLALFGAAVALAPTPALRSAAAGVLAVAVSSALPVVSLFLAGRSRAAAWAAATGVAVMASILGVALPAAEALRPVPAISAAVRKAGQVPVCVFGFDEPSLDVYASSRSIARIASARAVSAWAKGAGPGVLVTTASVASDLRLRDSPGVRVLGTAGGWNVATGRRLDLVALERNAR